MDFIAFTVRCTPRPNPGCHILDRTSTKQLNSQCKANYNGSHNIHFFVFPLSLLFTFPQNPNPSPPQPIPLLSPSSDLVSASLPCPPRRWRIWSLAVTGLALDGGSGLGLSSSRMPPPPYLRLPREGRR